MNFSKILIIVACLLTMNFVFPMEEENKLELTQLIAQLRMNDTSINNTPQRPVAPSDFMIYDPVAPVIDPKKLPMFLK